MNININTCMHIHSYKKTLNFITNTCNAFYADTMYANHRWREKNMNLIMFYAIEWLRLYNFFVYICMKENRTFTSTWLAMDWIYLHQTAQRQQIHFSYFCSHSICRRIKWLGKKYSKIHFYLKFQINPRLFWFESVRIDDYTIRLFHFVLLLLFIFFSIYSSCFSRFYRYLQSKSFELQNGRMDGWCFAVENVSVAFANSQHNKP